MSKVLCAAIMLIAGTATALAQGGSSMTKASGFVADGLKRSNQPDAVVAPPGN